LLSLLSRSFSSFFPQFVSQDDPLSFTNCHVSLTHEALSYHTKLESCPSPPLLPPSPALSSATSITTDGQISKRRRLVPSVSEPCIPARSNRSVSPNVRPVDSKIQGAPRRYRAILPAPAKRIAPKEISPQNIPRISISAPPSPHRRDLSISSTHSLPPAPFSHSPTDLPPRKYARGQDTPFRPEKLEGTIPGSMLEDLPKLEARFDRLENAIAKFAQHRMERALRNSLIDGLD